MQKCFNCRPAVLTQACCQLLASDVPLQIKQRSSQTAENHIWIENVQIQRFWS